MAPRAALARALPWSLALLLAACTTQRRRTVDASGQVSLGRCADVSRDGVLGARPRLRHANRDLDGDGQPELVVADAALCSRTGNCHWNLFARLRGDAERCHRYAGTVSAYAIEPMPARGLRGFADLRAFFRLAGDERLLVQHYRFGRGGYRVVDVLVCGRRSDQRIFCADDRHLR